MFSFLHAADIHLDSPLRGLEFYQDAPVDQIRNASRKAFDNMIELAIDERVSFVLLAGDIYDGEWKDYNTGLYFINRMGRLQRAGIPVFMVSGNHDAASQITRALKLPPNVTLFQHKKPETRILEDIGVAIHGQSFSSRAVSEDLSKDFPKAIPELFNIGILHTCLNGRPGHEPYAPCSLDSLLSKGYQYWALGHVHNREEVHKDPCVVFPGNIQGRHVREVGAKGCSLVTVDDGRVREIEPRHVDVLRWANREIDIGGCDTTDLMLKKIREELESEMLRADGRPLAVRLNLIGSTAINQELRANQAHWFEEVRGVSAGMEGVWIENLIINTTPEDERSVDYGEDSPFAAMEKSIEAIRSEGSGILDILPELEHLHNKLPSELTAERDPFSNGEGQLGAMLDEVREILMAKLRKGGVHEN